MPPSRFVNQEERLAAEGRAKYRGTARIRLEVLHFSWNEPREPNMKSVEKLKRCFEKGQCDRVTRNHIPAVIGQSQLDQVLRYSQVSPKKILSIHDGPHPELKFPAGFQLRCLHGRQRIQAAREVLPPRERWWTVDLYLEDIDDELKTALIEEYSNEERPSDGEIYCKIRQYQRERNLYSEKRWWARLSKHGMKCLEQLSRHPELKAAFDDLLGIPGLWAGMRLSTVDKMIAMRCDEEVLCYLAHIRDVWSKLLRHDQEAMRLVDQVTVKALELMAPKSSRWDAQILHGQLVSGQIFGAFSIQDREGIWNDLCTINGLIPSLFTLFEDLKYLQACAGSMAHLVELTPRQTMRAALDNVFCGTSQAEYKGWDSAYRRLWLYPMQHFRELPPPSKENNKKSLLAKTRSAKADEVILAEFAAHADQLGFQSEQILALKQRSSDWEIARDALLRARKPDRYEYDDRLLESHIKRIVRLFASATLLLVEQPRPALISDDPAASGIRCGFPDEEAYARDSKSLTVANLHAEGDELGEGITSFYVRRSVYFAFFGRPAETNATSRSPPPPTQGSDADQARPLPFPYSTAAEEGGMRGGNPDRDGLATSEREGLAQALLELERQVSVQEEVDPSHISERDHRCGTQLDIQKIIADGLASIREDPDDDAQAIQAVVHLEEPAEVADDRQSREDTIQVQTVSSAPSVIRIEFKIFERDSWRTDRSLLVDPLEPSEVERVAKKYMRKRFRPFDTSFKLLIPRTCFQEVTANGTNTILLVLEDDIHVDKQLVVFEPMSAGGLDLENRPKRSHLQHS